MSDSYEEHLEITKQCLIGSSDSVFTGTIIPDTHIPLDGFPIYYAICSFSHSMK